jgi:single-strand DNA-binding protein
MNLNSVTVTGRLTDDPELRHSNDDTPIATFALAIQRPPRGGEEQQPVFIDVVCFGRKAEAIAAHLRKGRRVAVQARLDMDRWTGDDDRTRTKHKLVANDVEFLDAPKTAAEPTAA